MWVKKTIAEIEEAKQKIRHSVREPLIGFVAAFVIMSIALKCGTGKNDFTPMSWNDFFSKVYIVLLFALFAASTVKYFQIQNNGRIFQDKPSVICNICHKIKSANEGDLCECGGQLMDLFKMKWIDNVNES